jgi:hypothetical protein
VGPLEQNITQPEDKVFYRGQEETHFSSGRVDVESFPARDTVPLRIDESAQVRIDLELFPARGHDPMTLLPPVVDGIHPTHTCTVDFPPPRSPIGATPLAVTH